MYDFEDARTQILILKYSHVNGQLQQLPWALATL